MRSRTLGLPLAAVALAAACRATAPVPAPALTPAEAASSIHDDVAYLASDRLEGRGTGTAGNDSAAAYIIRREESLGLRPVLQRFTARGAEMAHAGHPEGVPAQNVFAIIPGSDPSLRGQYVVVGAHFDHLGRSPVGAMDPEAKDAIRNGADDNASGTAAVLDMARRLAAHPTRRSILLAHFTGEELGLLGSAYFVEHAPVPLDSMDAMVNFDMVGRLRNDKLIVYGTGTATEITDILDSANASAPLVLSKVKDGFGPSDQSSFYAKGVPVLHFFTDLHDDYHKATDDADKIDAAGEVRVVTLAERVVRDIADRPVRLTPVRVAAPPVAAGSREGSGAYLGSVPDMSAGDGTGLKLTGVRAGSPADLAGLKPGDVVVQLGGAPVRELYSYTDALYAHKPGDKVEVVFLRAGQRMSTIVTLSKRGQ